MKLYYSPGACSLADHIALEEAGLSYTIDKVDLKAKTTESGRDFTAINPKGYVPALELDDGEVLTENIAILLYIADLSGRLAPALGMGRWRTIETTAFVSAEIHKNFKPFFNPAASAAERDEARAILTKRFALMEQRLGDRAFIVGEEITIADCYLFVMTLWAGKNDVALPQLLAAWSDRIARRPAVVRAMQDEGLR